MNVTVKTFIVLLVQLIAQSCSLELETLKSLTVKIDQDVSPKNCNRTLLELQVCISMFKYFYHELGEVMYGSMAI